MVPDFSDEAQRQTVDATWRVRRRWLPGHAWYARRWGAWRRRRKVDDAVDLADLPLGGGGGWSPTDLLDDILIGVAVLAAFAVVVWLLWFVLLPILLGFLDVLFVLVAGIIGLVGKELFRRPWTVSADGPDNQHREWKVVGWRRAGRVRHAVEEALVSGADADASASAAGAREESAGS